MSEIKDRLTKFLEYKGYGQLKFENTAGLGRGFVNKVGFNINAKSLEKIAKAYPELNIDWIKKRGDQEIGFMIPVVFGDQTKYYHCSISVSLK